MEPIFAATATLAGFDWLMSLSPKWFSTMFGPYYFAGGVVSFFAALTIVTFWLQGRGRVKNVIGVEHFHDYGKLLFAFVFFWAYLAFSQYMLIWYANIPEETMWFAHRMEHGWGAVSVVLPVVLCDQYSTFSPRASLRSETDSALLNVKLLAHSKP